MYTKIFYGDTHGDTDHRSRAMVPDHASKKLPDNPKLPRSESLAPPNRPGHTATKPTPDGISRSP